MPLFGAARSWRETDSNGRSSVRAVRTSGKLSPLRANPCPEIVAWVMVRVPIPGVGQGHRLSLGLTYWHVTKANALRIQGNST